jgi:diacylglycerol kinase family enzyme
VQRAQLGRNQLFSLSSRLASGMQYPAPEGAWMAYSVRIASQSLPGRKVAVVLNSRARHVTPEVLNAAREVVPTSDLFVSSDLSAARAIARTLIERGYDAVLSGGGDGTFVRCVSDLHAAAAQQGRRPPAIGVLRLGTGNAMADTVGVGPDRELAELLDSARSAPERTLPLLKVAGRLTPFAGIGLDAQILEDYGATGKFLDNMGASFVPAGAARYALAVSCRSVPRYLFGKRQIVTAVNTGAPALRLGADGKPVGESIAAGEVLYHGPVSMASASTIPYYGLGLRMFPFADAMPGRFQLRLANVGTAQILTHIPSLFKGTWRNPGIRDFLCDRVTLYLEKETALQVGGDLAGCHRTVTLALAPKPISIVS